MQFHVARQKGAREFIGSLRCGKWGGNAGARVWIIGRRLEHRRFGGKSKSGRLRVCVADEPSAARCCIAGAPLLLLTASMRGRVTGHASMRLKRSLILLEEKETFRKRAGCATRGRVATMARISSQLMSTEGLPDDWETSWESLIGSPRFEEARETCGCLIEDLKISVTPSSKNLGQQVVQQLAERKEKRRLYELQTVLIERKRIMDTEVKQKTGDSVDWAEKMKLENERRLAQLQEAAIKAKEVERKRTCFELAKSLAIETKAQQMMEENMRREARAKEVERQRVLEVQKQQLERKEKRIQMEEAKAKALQAQEEEMVRKLYAFKQMEELREEIKRRKALPPRFEPRA